MSFRDLVGRADSRIFPAVGELVTIVRSANAERLTGRSLVIERDVQVELGDVPTLGYTISYRVSDVGELQYGDRVETELGEVFILNRQIESDSRVTTRIAIKREAAELAS